MAGVMITSMSFSEDEESQSPGVVDDSKAFNTLESFLVHISAIFSAEDT